MRFISALALFAVLTGPVFALQTSRVLIDTGTSGFPTNGTVPRTWNDVDDTNMAAPFELQSSNGAATGITWSMPGTTFTASNSAGTSTPDPGSDLAEFPASVTQDVLYGQSGAVAVIELSGFSANTLASFTFAASRTNVTDNRSTDYLVQGFNGSVATLNPSNNTMQTAEIIDILPDGSGCITISVKAASANDNSSQYFYLGGIIVDLETFVSPPLILGFDQPSVVVSLEASDGPFSTDITVLESAGASPSISLSAIDDATSLAPTWFSLSASPIIGVPVSANFNVTSLALGLYTATVTVSASGYPDATLPVALQVNAAGGYNILAYGNSYSIQNGGVPLLAGAIAEEAGQPIPNVVQKLVGGQNLFFHLTDPSQAAAITTALPLGEKWDFVIMQGHSLEATTSYGDPASFRANALAILTNVRAHSPDAKAVMYQTWARGPGFNGYPGTYANPYEMHTQIHANYQFAVDDMNAAFGPGTAFRAAAGDAVALYAFDSSLYTPDQSHPNPPTSLMAAMAFYQAFYRGRVCDISPDFAGPSNLANKLTNLGLTASDWLQFGGVAERIADNDVRRWPGSSEDHLLRTGINGAISSCPIKSAGMNDVLDVSLSSPVGLYLTTPSFLFIDPFPTGGMPGSMNEWPEVHFNVNSSFIAKQTMMLPASWNFQSTIPDNFPGLSLRIQAISVAPSAVTGNLVFTITDGHEILLQ